jgi:signal transduction histidine kinase/CheY-like chemotaxis protein
MNETAHILVVDDDPVILALVKDLLAPLYRVYTATNGKEAQRLLQRRPCDLVLTDMVMPEMGGLELVRELHLQHPDLPVIVFTGYANFQDAVKAVKLGAFDYLTKPIQSEILHHAIHRALQFRRLTQQQKDLELILQGAEALGLQALDLVSGTHEARILTQLREKARQAMPPEELGRKLLKTAEKLVGAARSSIFLYEDRKAMFQPLAVSGPAARARRTVKVPERESLMGFVARHKRPLLVVDVDMDQRVALWTKRHPYASQSFIIIPLVGQKFWGVLNLTDRRDQQPFSPRDLFWAWLLGRVLVEALEARQLAGDLEATSAIDTFFKEHLPLGVALVDEALRVLKANRTLTNLLRLPDDPVGQDLSELLGLDSQDQETLKQAFSQVLAHQEVRELPVFKTSLGSGDSSFFGVRLIPSLLPQASPQAIVMVEDVSELEKLKQRLHLYEHLAIMGKLSLCVAHELNNPLDGVRRYLSLAQKKKSEVQEVERYLTEAQKGLQKMSMTIRSLLASANPLKSPKSVDNILNLLQDALKIMMFQANDQRVEVSFSASPELSRIPVEGDLYHVFVNVIKNALQAMPHGGKLRVEGEMGPEDIIIHFQDNGPGLTPEEMNHIFQPFYSTKEGIKGLGLGLPICRKILEKYAGKLVMESLPGKGTKVSIVLPKSGLGGKVAT